MKYAVETKIYNSGKSEISEIKIVDDYCKSTSLSHEKYTFYFDVFNSEEEAQDFIGGSKVLWLKNLSLDKENFDTSNTPKKTYLCALCNGVPCHKDCEDCNK